MSDRAPPAVGKTTRCDHQMTAPERDFPFAKGSAIAFMSGAILHCSAAELAGVAVAVAVIGGKIAAIPLLVCAVLRATA